MNSSRANGRPAPRSGVSDEEAPLLSGAPHRPPVSWRANLTRDVRRDKADLVLIFCYVITGLLDSSAISIWGSFVSMQTGNTVYIGLGLAAPNESTRWIKSLLSLACFCIGSFVFSRFHRTFGPKRRTVLCASFVAQMVLVATAAAIVTFYPPHSKESVRWNVLVPIALVAFQSCGQAITSRALKYNSLTSVVLTSIYCDLFLDAELFALQNAERNRRVSAPTLLLLGAVLGGVFAHSSLSISGALWTAAAAKLLVIVIWLFWPAERE